MAIYFLFAENSELTHIFVRYVLRYMYVWKRLDYWLDDSIRFDLYIYVIQYPVR